MNNSHIRFRTILTAFTFIAAAGHSYAADKANGFPTPSNIAEIHSLVPMDDAADKMLRQNGFVVLDTAGRSNLCYAYSHHGVAPHLYVTSDAMLALWSTLHRRVQEDTEQNVLAPKLSAAVSELVAVNVKLLAGANDPVTQQALKRNTICLLTAAQLLGVAVKAPADLKDAAAHEARLIEEHNVSEAYPGDDYTQYTVRGFYTDTPQLSRYFRAAMYLSRHFWPASPPSSNGDDSLRDAVVMASVLRGAPGARAAILQINSVRSALFGSPNAVSIEQIINAEDKLLGLKWTLKGATPPAAMTALRRELAASKYPKALVHTRYTGPGQDFPDQIVSLLPDIALPDSLEFQSTVNPAIPNRSLPSGLEVAAALGFEQPRRILAAEPNGDKIIAAVNALAPRYATAEGGAGLWYRALSELAKRDPRAPAFMQSEAWEAKQTSTALSSWAQLRHDAILEASQMYAQTLGIEEPHPALVEATPAVFDALVALADDLRSTIAQPAGIPNRSAKDLREFASECRAFSEMAKAELAGTVTSAQSRRAATFGAWLESFNLRTRPMVADVATGENGETLHVAAGAFHPIVVLPDPAHPVAYLGWTQSYYEVVRQDGQRLTDSYWETMATAKDSAVQRPGWTSQFVAPRDGASWAAREGLRHAEQLFLDGKNTEALSTLRSVVDANRTTDISTDAQLRIGNYYVDHKDAANAYLELLKCRSLPGGEAYDEAAYLISRLFYARTRKNQAFIRQRDKARQTVVDMIGKVEALNAGDVNRPALERQLVKLMLAPSDPGNGLTQDYFDRATAACHGHETHEVLKYAAAMNSLSGFSGGLNDASEPWEDVENDTSSINVGRESRLSQLPAIAESLHSPALKAALLAEILERTPSTSEDQVIAEMKPYLSGVVFQSKTDAVLMLLKSAANLDRRFELDPAFTFRSGLSRYRDERVRALWTSGKLERAIWLQRALLVSGEHADDSEGMVYSFTTYSDFNREPLRLKVLAESTESPALAAAKYADIYWQFPKSKLAPVGLWMGQSLYSQTGNQREALRLRGILQKEFAGTHPALATRAEDLYNRGDAAGALAIIKRMPEEDLQSRLSSEVSQSVQVITLKITREAALRALLARYSASMGLGAPPKKLTNEYALATSKGYIKRHPAEAAAVIKALINADPDCVQKLAVPLLASSSSSPAIFEIQTALRLNGAAKSEPDFPNGLAELVAIINRDKPGPELDAAILKLRSCLGSSDQQISFSAEINISTIVERSRYTIATYPGTHAAALAAQVAAQAMLDAAQPENALAILTDQRSKASETASQKSDRLLQRATEEIASKRGASWDPIWTYDMGVDLDMSDSGRTMAIPIEAGPVLALPYTKSPDDSGLAGLDTATGAEKWRLPLGNVSGLASASSGRLFASAAGQVISIDPATGTIIFKSAMDEGSLANAEANPPGAILLVQSGEVVIATEDNAWIAGFDANTGKRIWRKDWQVCGGDSQVSRPPAVIGSSVFLTTSDSVVHAITASTGDEIWSRSYAPDQANENNSERRPVDNHPVALDSTHLLLYVDKDLEILDAATGKITARHQHPQHATINDALFGGSGGWALEWTEQENAMLWSPSAQITEKLSIPQHNGDLIPAFDNGLMYFIGDENAYAADLATGARLGWHPVEISLLDWVTVGKNNVYFSSIEGKVTAMPRLSRSNGSSVTQ